MKTQRTSSRRSSGAHLDTTTIRLEEAFSLSCRRGGEGGGEDATIIECPSPQPSPHSFLAGRGRKFLVVVSRCAPGGQSQVPGFGLIFDVDLQKTGIGRYLRVPV